MASVTGIAIAATAAVALGLAAPAGAALGSSPPPQPLSSASGLGPGGVPDVGLDPSALGVRPEFDGAGSGGLARPRAESRHADVASAGGRGHGFVRDARQQAQSPRFRA
jgi:hypothetical protein